MKNTLEISRAASGQYTYRVLRDEVEIVSRQYGGWDIESTLIKATDRFSIDEVSIPLAGLKNISISSILSRGMSKALWEVQS